MKKSFVLGLVLVVLSLSGCKMLIALFDNVTVTFDLNGGHINGSTEKVTRTGNPEDEFLLPQNPFKNADASTRYRFDGWKAKERSYDFDYETFIDKKKQLATFPEGDISYVASWTIVQ